MKHLLDELIFAFITLAVMIPLGLINTALEVWKYEH